MTQIRIKVILNNVEEERLEYLKELFGIKNNAKLFKKMLEIKI